ncbi:flagellar motor switch protein FliN [Nocardioides sp. InS609-2]|uniref:flagellar motor switch protein FliN n=1 Tax=Nocardioides sp. InS609-2 TaxID=2760705 RepID=UPI0017F7C6BC|nr:flagellar motor switch protein FliN [Nocardioides sp. InS609-2]MBA3782684.1 flagellar motor switch protein FliN [Nocardioides sp.]
MSASITEAPGTATAAAVDAATAAAGVLPSVHPLVAGEPLVGDSSVVSSFAGGAVCGVSGGGRIAILVGADLVDALSSSPVAGLDLAAAVQPALDAAATSLGHRAEVGRQLSPAEIVADLGESFTVITLAGAGEVIAALLVPTSLLKGAAEPAPAVTAAPVAIVPRRGIELLHGVDMEVTVELGRTRMTVRDLLALAPGAVLELDRAAGSPADLLVNGRLIARGEVVVIDEDFGLRVTEIVDEKAAV